MFIISFVLITSCGNNNIYNQYKEYIIEENSIDSTKVLNSLEVRAFFYNYNVCDSELSSILISKRKKLNDEWKNHIEQ
tara:strand:- start:159 stop:392 length:234 start_codon:yes stop_codon:yes gene_type:complete